MKKNILPVLAITLLILGSINIQPIKAQHQGNFTINADGSISPSTAPIKQIDDVYTLIGDVAGSIAVIKSNITFDGNGHSIVGLGMGHGVGGLSIGCNYYSDPPILAGASNVTVKNLIVKGSPFGVSLLKATNCLVINNTLLETGNAYLSLDQQTAGIYVYRSSSNVIKANTLSNNYNGILFVECASNLIVENNITDCYNPWNYSAVGIAFWSASNNRIYHNNFLNNTVNAYSGITIAAAGVTPIARNLWDNGYPDGGNYWSDYQTKYPNANELNGSGIGNTAYQIDANNQDHYPLIEPFSTVRPTISTLSSSHVYNESSVPLQLSIDKPVDWMGYSLDGRANVTISGNETLTNVPNGFHTVTVYANDTFGNMGSETFNFTVSAPEAFPIATFMAVLGASAVAIGVGLIVYNKKRH